MTEPTKIFISYAQDRGFGQGLARLTQNKLEEQGYKTFRDETNIIPGSHWAREIEEQIESSQLVVLIMSSKIRSSDWVVAEYQYAKELGIPVIPLRAEEMITPLWLRSLQILDFSREKNWIRLIEAINSYTLNTLPSNKEIEIIEKNPSIIEISSTNKNSILDNKEFYKKSLCKISFDGNFLLLSNSNDIVLIDRKNNTLLHTLNGHKGDITSCSFSSDGKKIASASDDGVIKLWNTNTGECIATYEAKKDDYDNTVNHCIFSPDNQQLLTTGNYSTHIIWSLGSGEPIETFHGFHLWSYLVKFSPDGKLILTVNKLGHVELWDIEKKDWRKGLYDLDEYGSEVSTGAFKSTGCSFSPNSMMVGTVSDDAISIWEINGSRKIKKIITGQKNILSCSFSSSSESVISLSGDGVIKKYNIRTRECILTQKIGINVFYSYGFSDNSNYIFFEDDDLNINLWSILEGRVVLKITKQNQEVRSNLVVY